MNTHVHFRNSAADLWSTTGSATTPPASCHNIIGPERLCPETLLVWAIFERVRASLDTGQTISCKLGGLRTAFTVACHQLVRASTCQGACVTSVPGLLDNMKSVCDRPSLESRRLSGGLPR